MINYFLAKIFYFSECVAHIPVYHPRKTHYLFRRDLFVLRELRGEKKG